MKLKLTQNSFVLHLNPLPSSRDDPDPDLVRVSPVVLVTRDEYDAPHALVFFNATHVATLDFSNDDFPEDLPTYPLNTRDRDSHVMLVSYLGEIGEEQIKSWKLWRALAQTPGTHTSDAAESTLFDNIMEYCDGHPWVDLMSEAREAVVRALADPAPRA